MCTVHLNAVEPREHLLSLWWDVEGGDAWKGRVFGK
jgi:hypothetical protein